jgi:hypothetical protein
MRVISHFYCAIQDLNRSDEGLGNSDDMSMLPPALIRPDLPRHGGAIEAKDEVAFPQR